MVRSATEALFLPESGEMIAEAGGGRNVQKISRMRTGVCYVPFRAPAAARATETA
jgi:hypothetical protein